MAGMTEEEFEEYLNSISDTDKFKEIDSVIKFSHYTTPNTIFGKLSRYLGFFHSKTLSEEERIKMGTNGFFIPDYDYFKEFFEHYKDGKFQKNFTEDGYIDLKNTLFLEQPPMFSRAHGWFTDSYLLFADGDMSISKYPLYYKSTKSAVSDKSCVYCPIIGTGIAKALGVNTSENTFAVKKDSQLRILSKNFLRPEEEMITFVESDDKIQNISTIFSLLEENLTLRNFPTDEIADAKLNFLKQEFVAKLIGLKDQKGDNTGLIVSTDETGRHVRLAPMFDYDYSFHIGADKDLPLLICDNGQADIASLIKQYKDYPGFLDFVRKSVNSLDMNKVYKGIFEDTGIKDFENPEGNETFNIFTNFVNENLGRARQALHDLTPNERGEK